MIQIEHANDYHLVKFRSILVAFSIFWKLMKMTTLSWGVISAIVRQLCYIVIHHPINQYFFK